VFEQKFHNILLRVSRAFEMNAGEAIQPRKQKCCPQTNECLDPEICKNIWSKIVDSSTHGYILHYRYPLGYEDHVPGGTVNTFM